MDVIENFDPTVDEVASEPPSPEFMEGTNVWLWDAQGRVSIPRVAVDAMAPQWDDKHMISLNLTLPGGRVLIVRGFAPPLPAADAQGRPRVRGAGPLRFDCLEPFHRWVVRFDGLAGDTTIENQIARRMGGLDAIPEPSVPVKFEVEHVMTGTPWSFGTFETEGIALASELRIEQLCSATGQVEVDGTTYPLEGGGVRIHRKGTIARSNYSDWMGHVWMSSQFPSGRAFGVDQFAPHPDGTPRFHEGWLWDGEELLAAKFVEAPWKREWVPAGEDVSFTLRTKRGEHRISATTVTTTCNPIAQPPDGRKAFPSTQQGTVLYRWEDEEAYGMIERSSPLEEPAS